MSPITGDCLLSIWVLFLCMWDIEQFWALLLLMILRCMACGIPSSRLLFSLLAGFFKESREHMSFCSVLVMIRFTHDMLHVECLYFRAIPLVFAHGFSSAWPVLVAVRLYEAKRLWFSLKAAQTYSFLSVHQLCSTKLEPAQVQLSRNWTAWCQHRYVPYPSHPPSYSFSFDLELCLEPLIV